ncbi:MAG: type II secretion system protein [Pseudomonadota bacterium]
MKIKYKQGFTLVELAIVLAIISILVGAVITVGLNSSKVIFLGQTNNKIEVIAAAIDDFVLVNKRLPCPANGVLASDEIALGDEFISGSSCDVTSDDGGLMSTTDIIIGTLPYNALDIPKEYIFDGWDRRFSYVITRNLSLTVGTNNFYNSDGAIIIDNQHTLNTQTISDNAAYVIISHGENGSGAFRQNGGTDRIDDGGNAGEEENAPTPSGHDHIFVSQFIASDFDDILYFKTKNMILMENGKAFANEECLSAEAIVADGSACDQARDPEQCRVIAEVYASELCL